MAKIPTRANTKRVAYEGMPGVDLFSSMLAIRYWLSRTCIDPALRPPSYEEIAEDAERVISKIASRYIDQSCVELHFEDLKSSCQAKTIDMINKGLLYRCRNRVEFFNQLKTAIKNHVCSLVQRHRFTEKRTGIKPPPKDQRNASTGAATKPNEVRIDDPESGFQLSDISSDCEARDFKERMEEAAAHLNYIEAGVLQQLTAPNTESLLYARLDAERGRKPGAPLNIKLRQEHLAHGLSKEGFTAEQFQATHEIIKRKCAYMKGQTDGDPRKPAALATLINFFGVQIPQSIDEVTRKRALMLAAQHQYDRLKDDDGIKEALRICGIPIPVVRHDSFACLGVLYQKNHRTCSNCGMREACEMQAANYGLGEFTLSRKLLTSRHIRRPIITPLGGSGSTRFSDDSAFIGTEREDEILRFLDENFKMIVHQGYTHYRHRDRLANDDGMQLIFSIGRQATPLRLRFINPSLELQAALKLESSGEKGGRPAWCLPDSTSAEEAINLIRAHAKATFTPA